MTQISGPINLIRMEGNINGINKVFYIFMDIHADPHSQTECMDARTVHIRNYLVNAFDQLANTDRTVDFFLEAFPDTSTDIVAYSDIYLGQLRKMFELIFKFDFKENRVVKSNDFPNVRLHYIDIRSYFTFTVGNPFGIADSIGGHIWALKDKPIHQNDITMLKNSLDILNSQTGILHKALYSPNGKVKSSRIIRQYPPSTINYDKDKGTKVINSLVNKITNVYDNKNVKQTINSIIDKNADLFDQYAKLYNEFYKYLDDIADKINYGDFDKVNYDGKPEYFMFVKWRISDDIIAELLQKSRDLRNIIINMHLSLMDLYLLRRTLDKKYVKTAIVYTGAMHSANYINILANNFDFKVTHAHYSKFDIPEINKKIRSNKTIFETEDLFFPPKFYQCVDVSKFPPNFT